MWWKRTIRCGIPPWITVNAWRSMNTNRMSYRDVALHLRDVSPPFHAAARTYLHERTLKLIKYDVKRIHDCRHMFAPCHSVYVSYIVRDVNCATTQLSCVIRRHYSRALRERKNCFKNKFQNITDHRSIINAKIRIRGMLRELYLENKFFSLNNYARKRVRDISIRFYLRFLNNLLSISIVTIFIIISCLFRS